MSTARVVYFAGDTAGYFVRTLQAWAVVEGGVQNHSLSAGHMHLAMMGVAGGSLAVVVRHLLCRMSATVPAHYSVSALYSWVVAVAPGEVLLALANAGPGSDSACTSHPMLRCRTVYHIEQLRQKALADQGQEDGTRTPED